MAPPFASGTGTLTRGFAFALATAAALLLAAESASAAGTPAWATEGAWLDYEMDLSCSTVSPAKVRATLTRVDDAGADFRLDWPPGGCMSQTHYVPWNGGPDDTIYYMDPDLWDAPGVEYGTITPGILGRTEVIGPSDDPQTNYDAETGVLLQYSAGATLVAISFDWPAETDEAGSPALDLDADGIPDAPAGSGSKGGSKANLPLLLGGGAALAVVAGAVALATKNRRFRGLGSGGNAKMQSPPPSGSATAATLQQTTAGPITGGKGYSVDTGRWVEGQGAPGPPAPPALSALVMNTWTRTLSWIPGPTPAGAEIAGYRITEFGTSAGGEPMAGASYDLPAGASSWSPTNLPPGGGGIVGYHIDVLYRPVGGTGPPWSVAGGYRPLG